MLGGGDFSGVVHLRLGDPPAARRVKINTVVRGFDARRLAWHLDPAAGGRSAAAAAGAAAASPPAAAAAAATASVRDTLGRLPPLSISAESCFAGVLQERLLIPPGATALPRSPESELVSADGALALRRLRFNGVAFPSTLRGTVRASADTFGITLVDAHRRGAGAPAAAAPRPDQPGDLIRVTAAVPAGEATLTIRRGRAAFHARLIAPAGLPSAHLSVDARAVDIGALSGTPSAAGILTGRLDADVPSHSARGSVSVERPAVGAARLSAAAADVLWLDRTVVVQRAVVRRRRSEVHVEARADLPPWEGPHAAPTPAAVAAAAGWEVKAVAPRLDVRDMVHVLAAAPSRGGAAAAGGWRRQQRRRRRGHRQWACPRLARRRGRPPHLAGARRPAAAAACLV